MAIIWNEAFKQIKVLTPPDNPAIFGFFIEGTKIPETTIIYNDSLVASFGVGTATLPVKDLKMKTDIVITVPEAESGTDSAIPIEVSTEAEMTALLTSGEVGGVYKYTGTSGTYENGALYVLEEETASYTVKIAALGDGNVSSYKMNGNNSVDLEIHYAIRSADQATQEIMEQYATTLTDVSSLVCYLEGDDTDNCVVVYDSNFNQVHSEYNNFAEVDVTSYLSEGCYVLICTNS
jgi:hypothetical protein